MYCPNASLSVYSILTSGLPRRKSKIIAIQLSQFASDRGLKTEKKVEAKYRRSSHYDRDLFNANRKMDSCGDKISAKLLGEYHSFLYLHTKLQ